MKVIVAPDSFKECLSSQEVAPIVTDEIRKLRADWTLISCPLSDGGEGFAEILTEALGGLRIPVSVSGPLGGRINTFYGRVGDTAILDVASSCGLQLVPKESRNPLITTSLGVGEMLLAAYKDGCRKAVIGLGGSSTCDGGEGMMAVEGIREIAGKISVEALCDVTSPFIGPCGAARVFVPQKGADAATVELLEERMRKRAAKILSETGKDIADVPGAGAAGGLAGCLMAYFDARILPGIDTFLDYIGFDSLVRGAGLVITGEGCSDSQTLLGKAPSGVLRRAGGVPVVLLSGAVRNREALLKAGFADAVAVTPVGMPLPEALRPEVAEKNLRAALPFIRDSKK